jgi:putative addiction module killer protein
MLIINRTDEFNDWLHGLRDQAGRGRILMRLRRAEDTGNFGDCKLLSEGVSEMRIDTGPGYRVYFVRQGDVIYLLLSGGDKSTQDKDIQRAINMWSAIQKEQQ